MSGLKDLWYRQFLSTCSVKSLIYLKRSRHSNHWGSLNPEILLSLAHLMKICKCDTALPWSCFGRQLKTRFVRRSLYSHFCHVGTHSTFHGWVNSYSRSSTTTVRGTEMLTYLSLFFFSLCVKVTDYHGSHICQLCVLSFLRERFAAQRIVFNNSHSYVFGLVTGSGLWVFTTTR